MRSGVAIAVEADPVAHRSPLARAEGAVGLMHDETRAARLQLVLLLLCVTSVVVALIAR